MTGLDERIVIVGAGISGLSLAYRLFELLPDADITILEEKDRVGGTIWTERQDGFQVEYGPNGFLDTNPTTLRLCQDLGMEADLLPANEAAARRRFLCLDGRLHLLPYSLPSFLASDLLSWRGKMSIVAERFWPCRPTSEDESIDAFVSRHFGREAAQVFANALVTGIQAGDPTLLSMRACFPRVANLEREYGSVLKGMSRSARARARVSGEGSVVSGQQALDTPKHSPLTTHHSPTRRRNQLWSLRGGMRELVETLARKLPKQPLLGVGVTQIHKSTEPETRPAWTVRDPANSWQADVVILTCPAHRQPGLLDGVDKELADQVRSMPYNKVAVVALGYREADVPRTLDGFGFISPESTRRDTLGVLWCSSIFSERAPPGTVLVRAMAGGWNRPDVLSWPDARLTGAVRSDLRQTLGIETRPILERVIRWENAIPQYLVGHLDRVVRIERRAALHPGLFLGGNAYRGITLNDCTEQAQLLAQSVAAYLERPSSR